MAITALSALWFFILALPISIWVAWNDMKFMKIPNKAVVALTAGFLIVGFFVLPLADIPWQLLQLIIVLVVGFLLNMVGAIGAGDAKFAAAMAPFVAYGDIRVFLYLFVAVLVAAVVTHRIVKRLDFVRKLTPDWASWETRSFPMGLALGPTIAFYLLLGAVYGA